VATRAVAHEIAGTTLQRRQVGDLIARFALPAGVATFFGVESASA